MRHGPTVAKHPRRAYVVRNIDRQFKNHTGSMEKTFSEQGFQRIVSVFSKF